MTQHNAALVEETNAAIEQTEVQASELDGIVDIFTVSPSRDTESKSAPAVQAKSIPARIKTAAKSYLTRGNTALAQDWSEF